MASICYRNNSIYLTTYTGSKLNLKFDVSTEFNYSNEINLSQMTLLYINNKNMYMHVSLENNILIIKYDNKLSEFSLNSFYQLTNNECDKLICEYLEMIGELKANELYDM